MRILVVGGGIAGAAVALHARRLGAEVVLLDRARPGGNATAASAGMLAPQYEAEWETPLFRLLLHARRMHPDFLAHLEALAGRSVPAAADGMLVASFEPHEEDRARERARWQRERGLRAEVLDADEAGKLLPGAAPDARSFLWLPDEAHVDTQRLADVLPAALEGAAVEVRTGAAARSVDSTGGRVTGVGLDDGTTVEADAVVVAAGAWAGSLEGLPRPLPVRPVRGQMIRYPAGEADVRRLLANPGGRYLVPRPDGSVLAGSTMEAAGFDASTTEPGLRAIRLAAERLCPALAGVEPLETWAGLRPDTPDEHPVIGPDPEMDGLFYAAGYGRNGILLAPAAGRAAAELAVTGETEIEWRPFRADRFTGRPQPHDA